MNKAQSTMDQGTKKSNAVAEKVAAGALAVSLFEEDADKGLSNMGHEDLALPFLKILMYHSIGIYMCSFFVFNGCGYHHFC